MYTLEERPKQRIRRMALAGGVAVSMLLTACGGAPTTEGAAAGGQAPEAPTLEGLEDVYAAVDGMSGDERRQKLIELAKAEGGSLQLYTAWGEDDIAGVSKKFKAATGITLEVYRATGNEVLTRLDQELSADRPGGDVMATNDLEMTIAGQQEFLAALKTPATEGNINVHPSWAASYQAAYMAAWNSDKISPDQAPKSWDDVFCQSNTVGFQVSDYAWFATLVDDYYVAELGMTVDEAVAHLKDCVSKSGTLIDGHSLAVDLLSAGGYDQATSVYLHEISSAKAEGAPIEWEPLVKPVIVRTSGIGIVKNSEHPAAALLFTEYVLDDVQKYEWAEFSRTPAVPGADGSLPADFDFLPLNIDAYQADQDAWDARLDDITHAVGGEVQAD